MVLLDERGRQLTSEEFANFIEDTASKVCKYCEFGSFKPFVPNKFVESMYVACVYIYLTHIRMHMLVHTHGWIHVH